MNPIVEPERARNEARRLIRDEVMRKYEFPMKQAGFFGQLVLHLKIELEVYRELKRRFPPGALYVQKA